MVKIRVHSRDDIIKAYLRRLGYGADIDISMLLASYESLNRQDDINKAFDDIIYKNCYEISKMIDYLDNRSIILEILDKFSFYERIIHSFGTQKQDYIFGSICRIIKGYLGISSYCISTISCVDICILCSKRASVISALSPSSLDFDTISDTMADKPLKTSSKSSKSTLSLYSESFFTY